MTGNHLEVIVDNKPIRALVDSGASFSIISDRYRRYLKKVMFSETKNVVLKVANGSFVRPMGKCMLRVIINSRELLFEFVILRHCSHDVILGWDFLEAFQAVIDCGRSELFLEDVCQEPSTLDSWKLYAIEDCTLEPRSLSRIAVSGCQVGRDLNVVVEGNKNLLFERNIAIPSILTSYNSSESEIWVTNTQSEKRVILKGMCVGRAELLDERHLCAITDTSNHMDALTETTQFCIEYSLMISPDLSNEQKGKLEELLRTFSGVFVNTDKSTAARTNVKHRINTGDYAPVKQKAYRVSPTERRIIREEVDKMLDKGIIQPSESPWSSPVVLVRKKDGSWRFCVDYRKLNTITTKDVYPLPRIDDTLDSLKGAQFFSSMDLRSGYWQIEVDEADREKTAFVTPEGLYEFKVMPFGLCNAPATFERMMDNLLRHLKWTMCLCYLDDIIVFSETFKDHISRLRTVLKCIQEAGLVLNPKKCLFAAREVKILGHLVSRNGVRPDPDKVRAVRNFPTPKNVRDIRSFLGLCSYFQRFIKGFCYLAEPLQLLLKRDAKFHFGAEEAEAFDNLKAALTSDPVLGLYDENSPTEIHTDASGYGIGAVLVQIQKEVEKVIAYASRTLTKAEKNYSTTERECLAVVWAINKFQPYLFGRHFTDPSGRLARWALRLQEHDFSVMYKTGKKHKDADTLSRNPVDEDIGTSDEVLAVITNMNLAIEQKKDPNLTKINLAKTCPPTDEDEFKLIDGILYRKNFDPTGKKWLPVIPKHLRKDVLKHFHDAPTAGHLGFAKTYDRIRKRFYWPGMYRNIVRYVMHCHDCQRRKSIPQRPPGRLVSIPPAMVPFHRIGVDLLGRFPKSARGNKWIIVCTDYSTRYATTKALPTAEAEEVAKFLLEEILLRHGAPRVIITDRGTVFQSRLVSTLAELCNIDHRMTTAYHPQTNGLTERFNKTLADMLSMYVNIEQRNWDEILPFVTFAYNTAKQETTGSTPFYLLHGREAETTLDTMLPVCPDDVDND
ncbi:Transposon Ty3-I Gag-Pol polyprotein, partial [Araneus ventricosus]